MCLIARHFENNRIPTIILGSALDILESGRPPRVKFLDYPLGFESGRPFDPENQLAVVGAALAGIDNMDAPGIEPLDFNWDEGWRMIEERNKDLVNQDLRSFRDTSPQYQTEQDRELAESKR